MPDPATVLLFMSAVLVLNLTPGPDMIYVITRSLAQGARAGVAAATGAVAGSIAHTLCAVAGLSAILLTSATAFTAVKLAGAAYLIYLGVRALLRRRGELADKLRAGSPMATRRIMWQAFIIHTLNPKVAIFFVAFLPQFVGADDPSPATTLTILGAVYIVQAWAVNSMIALAAGGAKRLIADRPMVPTIMDRVSGVLFVALGVRLGLASR